MKHPRRQHKRRVRVNRVTDDTPQRDLPTEGTLQKALRNEMHKLGWLTAKTHGSMLQRGWPDLYIAHAETRLGPDGGYGRDGWIETKSLRKYHYLEKSQIALFTKWSRFGVGIWVLRGPDEYDLLFEEANWNKFLPMNKELRE